MKIFGKGKGDEEYDKINLDLMLLRFEPKPINPNLLGVTNSATSGVTLIQITTLIF